MTAITGLLVVLNQTGVIGNQDDATGATDGTTTSTSIESSLEGEGDAIAGMWEGTAKSPDGSNSFTVELVSCN